MPITGLYVAIPFCFQKCHYCDFVITLDRTSETKERFFLSFEKEAARAQEEYGKIYFDTFYLGGGTPSLLSSEEMARLAKIIKKYFDFKPAFEWTCEVNPGDVDAEKLAAYRRLGINRISIGAQTFNDGLLKKIGRHHSSSDIGETVRLAKEAGFENISLDLMVRLPGQTTVDVEASLRCAIALEVAQISIYDLEVHENTFFGSEQKRDKLLLPDDASHHQMSEKTENILEDAGYSHYELTNFSKPGFECKHNLIYWKNKEYLGLGPGAFSHMASRRYQFASSVSRYFNKLDKNDWRPDAEEILTEEKKEWETLITGLRLKDGISIDGFKWIRESLNSRAAELEQLQLLEKRGDRIILSRQGRFLAETAFSKLLEK